MEKTFELKDLKLSEINRNISENHVKRLKDLIEKHGYVNGLPIIVDKEGFIIDGQHRYKACLELGIEPTIVVNDNFDVVPIINSSQIKWSMKDYVKYYAGKGFPDFIILENLCKEKEISPNIAFNIIFGRTVDRTGLTRKEHVNAPLKDGTFKFPEHSKKYFEKLERKIDAILNLVRVLNLPKTDRLVVAITRLTNNRDFSFNTMLKKLEYQMSRVYRCSTIDEYTNMLINIYNNKNNKKLAV